MAGPMHFDARAATYERARPPYPEELWGCLGDFGLLRPGMRVVELGAGTGQATARLIDAGADVTAVEPGPSLAVRLRERCPGGHVVVPAQRTPSSPRRSTTWLLPPRRSTGSIWMWCFPSCIAHWFRAVGSRCGVPRSATPAEPRRSEIASTRSSPAAAAMRPARAGELDTAEWARRLSARGEFTVVHVDRFRWGIDLDTDQVHDLFSTFSNWTSYEVAAAADAVRELGGTVTEHYVSPLILLERADHHARHDDA